MPLSTAGRLDLPNEIVSISASPTPTGELIHDPRSTLALFSSIIVAIFNGNDNLRPCGGPHYGIRARPRFSKFYPNFTNEVPKCPYSDKLSIDIKSLKIGQKLRLLGQNGKFFFIQAVFKNSYVLP